MPRDWLRTTHPKLPILCRVGYKTSQPTVNLANNGPVSSAGFSYRPTGTGNHLPVSGDRWADTRNRFLNVQASITAKVCISCNGILIHAFQSLWRFPTYTSRSDVAFWQTTVDVYVIFTNVFT